MDKTDYFTYNTYQILLCNNMIDEIYFLNLLLNRKVTLWKSY